jgi:hypothetical protein
VSSKVRASILRGALIAAITLILMEVVVRVFAPQPQLYPRYRSSERFGHVLPESATIVSEQPGAWRFVYRTNEYGFRVSMPEISNRYDAPNVVVLGDSVTFGQGVNDGEEYPAKLAKSLAGHAGVVNLGVPGFGLTHQIRVFYEFGVLFQPALVLLQFTTNDPNDNLYEKVTTVEDGRFRFHRAAAMSGATASIKDWLSGSLLQRSAAYNFVRNKAYRAWHARVLARESGGDARARTQAFYNQLLRAFAQDLRQRGVRLILFDVPGHLAAWPEIHAQARTLERDGLLQVLDTREWFNGATDFGTPEGHYWGAKGHRIVAERLAAPVTSALNDGGSKWNSCCRSGGSPASGANTGCCPSY